MRRNEAAIRRSKKLLRSNCRWNFSWSLETVDFDGPETFPELLEALEEEFSMEIEKNLGVPADWKPEKGQTLTSEQVFALTVRRSLFGRLARVFKSTGFDKEAALNLINLIGNIRYLLSTAAIEAFIEGRKEVQEWIAQGYREGKITLSAEVQKQFKQFLSKTDQFRHQVVKHLAKKFPEKRISPHKLHALPKDIRKAGRDFLHRQFGNSLQANNIIKEVFRKPRKPRTQRVNEPFRNASQFTPHG